ncbi:MAG: hypothetical protein A2Z20_00125 [Bdellovibrionales bacterium RBG_16_40_8]|nr:MAG: hypothetical protein A2Z20_00125 [Bdellovibrionales bacterium RBG_16_40_8]
MQWLYSGKISYSIKMLQRSADRLWYLPFMCFLAAIDYFVIVIPVDGILISSSMLLPKRWFMFALSVAIGSVIGAILLAAMVELHGLPWILEIYPGINESRVWILALKFFENYGILLIFLLALTPLAQQPLVIMASLANTSLIELTIAVLFGRLIKCLIISYIGSHTPRLISKIWGIKGELKDAGITGR